MAHRMVVTRSASATDVVPFRHFPTASSIIVVIPALMAAASTRRIGIRPDQVADLARDVENLEHADPAAITDAAASLAALRAEDRVARFETQSRQPRIGVEIRRGSELRWVLQRSQSTRTSRWAITARKVDFNRKASAPRSISLGTAAVDGLGMQRRQNEMSGQRRMDGDARGLGVAHLAHHDDIRILSHERPHRGGESQPDRGLDLRLVDAGNFVFDGILDRQDLARRRVERREHGRQRRRLAAARRAGDGDHAMGQIEQAPELVLVARRQARASRMSSSPRSRGSKRMTADSPCCVGMVATRRSISVRAARSRAAPSCGSRRSAMLSPARILMREIERLRQHVGGRGVARNRPSTRMRTVSPSRNGSMWISLARNSTAFSMRSLTARTTGAPLARSRRLSMLSSAPACVAGRAGPRRIVGVELIAENGRDVFKRSRRRFQKARQTRFPRLSAPPRRWDRRRQNAPAIGLKRENRRLTQKPGRKTIGQRT